MQWQLALGLMILVIFQLGLLSFYLFTTIRGKRVSNVLLGIFFLLLALSFTEVLLKVQGLQSFYRPLALVDDSFLLLYGPLIYFYTYSIIYKQSGWRKSWWLHLMPFLLLLAYFLLISNLLPSDQHQQLLREIEEFKMPFALKLAVLLVYLHPLIYLMLSFRLLSRYRKHIKQVFSNIETRDLGWLAFTVKSTALLMLASFIHALLPALFTSELVRLSLLILIVFTLYFVNRVLLKALRQSTLLQSIVEIPEQKYRGSNLSDQRRLEISGKLEKLIQKEKPHLNSDLSIDQLAKSLEVPAKTLSQVINQTYGRSFFDWINAYRIKEAEKLLTEQPKSTVLEILYACGFNSKSSFNSIFKKQTGFTPSQFRVRKKG